MTSDPPLLPAPPFGGGAWQPPHARRLFVFSLQLGDWVAEKMLMAQDTVRDDGQKLHKKWLKHQAFMAELAQNKEWLDKIEKVSGAAGGRGVRKAGLTAGRQYPARCELGFVR